MYAEQASWGVVEVSEQSDSRIRVSGEKLAQHKLTEIFQVSVYLFVDVFTILLSLCGWFCALLFTLNWKLVIGYIFRGFVLLCPAVLCQWRATLFRFAHSVGFTKFLSPVCITPNPN